MLSYGGSPSHRSTIIHLPFGLHDGHVECCSDGGVPGIGAAAGKSLEIARKARQRGCEMDFFCLARNPDEIRPVVAATQPFALVHHGGATDRRFAEGKGELVHDFVRAVHD